MSIARQISIGLSTYPKALKFIAANNLTKFFLVPLVLNILLFLGGMELIQGLTDWFDNAVLEHFSEWVASSSLGGVFETILSTLIKIVFYLTYLVLFAFFGGYIVMVLMSPLFAYISERTEQIVTGNAYKFNFKQFVSDVFRGIFIATRNLLMELIFIIIFFFLGFIPIINLSSPLGLFMVSSYYYGFSFMDYSNERRKRNLKQGISFIKKNKGLATANGAVFSLFLLVPVIGVWLSSFVSLVAVVAATLAYLEVD